MSLEGHHENFWTRMDLQTLTATTASLATHGLIVERLGNGSLRANVAHVRYHSTLGVDVGYLGSGPADLALSVLHALLPPPSQEEERAQFDLDDEALERAMMDPQRWSETIGVDKVRVSKLALMLHQDFKADVIAKLDADSDFVPIAVIRQWIASARRRLRL